MTTSATKPAAPSEKSGSLRDLAVRGGAYLAARELIGMFLRLAGMVLTLREIGPADYGIYSSGLAYIAVATVIAQMGTEIYLIRMPREPTKRDYNEAFTHLVISSLLVTLVAEALTIPLGEVIKPAGTLIPLRVMLLSIPMNVLWAPGQAFIERAFDYRKMGLLELGGDVVLYGVSVPLAFCGFGTWAMVAGLFAWQGFLFVGSIVVSGLRYRFAFSRAGTKAMLTHGASYSTYSIINTLEQLLVPVVVGSLGGAVGVGYVSFAQRLTVVLAFAQRNLSRIGIVAITRARNKTPHELGKAMTDGTVMMLFTTAIPFAAFGLVARFIVPIVFGPAWTSALPLYVCLAVWSVISVFNTCRYALFFARNENLKAVKSNAIQLVIMAALSYPLVKHFGPVGFGYATLASLCSVIYSEWAAKDIAPISYRRLAAPTLGLLPPLIAPLILFPFSLLTLIGPALILVVPSTRRDAVEIARTALGAVRGRIGSSKPTVHEPRHADSTEAAIAALPPGHWILTGRAVDGDSVRSVRVFVPPPVTDAGAGGTFASS